MERRKENLETHVGIQALEPILLELLVDLLEQLDRVLRAGLVKVEEVPHAPNGHLDPFLAGIAAGFGF